MHRMETKGISTRFLRVPAHVGARRMQGRKQRKKCHHHLRIGHTGLSHTLYKMGKQPTGKFTHCSQPETLKHVLRHCKENNIKRNLLFQSLRKAKYHTFSLSGLFGKIADKIYGNIIKFLKELREPVFFPT